MAIPAAVATGGRRATRAGRAQTRRSRRRPRCNCDAPPARAFPLRGPVAQAGDGRSGARPSRKSARQGQRGGQVVLCDVGAVSRLSAAAGRVQTSFTMRRSSGAFQSAMPPPRLLLHRSIAHRLPLCPRRFDLHLVAEPCVMRCRVLLALHELPHEVAQKLRASAVAGAWRRSQSRFSRIHRPGMYNMASLMSGPPCVYVIHTGCT